MTSILWKTSVPGRFLTYQYQAPFPFLVKGGRIPPISGRRNPLLLDQNEVRCSDGRNRSMRDFRLSWVQTATLICRNTSVPSSNLIYSIWFPVKGGRNPSTSRRLVPHIGRHVATWVKSLSRSFTRRAMRSGGGIPNPADAGAYPRGNQLISESHANARRFIGLPVIGRRKPSISGCWRTIRAPHWASRIVTARLYVWAIGERSPRGPSGSRRYATRSTALKTTVRSQDELRSRLLKMGSTGVQDSPETPMRLPVDFCQDPDTGRARLPGSGVRLPRRLQKDRPREHQGFRCRRYGVP